MSLKTLFFNIRSKIHFEQNFNFLNIRRCLILRHYCITDNMSTPIKSNRKRSRDYQKLSLNKYSNVVVDLTESKVLNKICDQNIEALNNTNISNKKTQISQSVVEISSDSEPEQIITLIKPQQIITQEVSTEKSENPNSYSKADIKVSSKLYS